MSTPTTRPQTVPDADAAAVRKAIASSERPPRASAATAAWAFGWRGMLKIKHVPEQLIDVTITPVLFTLLFTYVYGGAISGSTGAHTHLAVSSPGSAGTTGEGSRSGHPPGPDTPDPPGIGMFGPAHSGSTGSTRASVPEPPHRPRPARPTNESPCGPP